MCANVFCIMYENLWISPRTSVNNLRANTRTHTHSTICIFSWYLHLMCYYKLAVASALTAVCLSCCLSLWLSLSLLPSCLPPSFLSPPVPSDCLPVHVLVAAEQSLRSNETQNKFINFPVEICAVCTASVIPHLSLPLLVSLPLSIDAGVTTEINWKLIS